ncbi:MAG TPA: carboxypeptidase-like regulatory domain-containing protein [Chloroflexota bacterium]|nr:carboxypeptidase-like regulatory domain-containing protein [Chloroflexota bacterium]
MNRKQRTRLAGIALVVVGLLTLGGASTAAMADPSDGAISGTVTDAATHSGLAGIEVCAEVPSSLAFECATTDGTGSYTITGLAPESYTVRFYADADHVEQYFDGVTNYNDATLVEVTAGATTPSIDAVMQIASKITGTITDAVSHAPVEGISACATKLDGSLRRCGASGSGGTYSITGLDPGSYKVRFYEEGLGGLDSGENYLEQFYDGVREESQAQPVSVTTGYITTGIDAAMDEGGIITGRVTDAVTGDPLAYAHVCASHYEEEEHDPGTDRCTEAEVDGSYLIAGLTTSDYAIYVEHVPVPSEPFSFHSLNYAPQFYNDKPNFETAIPFHVTERQTFPGIDFAMHAGATISGRIVDSETHQPVEDVVVTLWCAGCGDYSDDPYWSFDQIERPDGQFRIVGMPTGTYYLEMYPFGSSEGIYPSQYLSGKANSWTPGVEKVSLVPGHDTSLGDVELFKEVEGSEPEEDEEQAPDTPGTGSGGGNDGPAVPPSSQSPPPPQNAPAPSHQHAGPSTGDNVGTAVVGRVAIAKGNAVLVPLRCRSDVACRGVAKLLAKIDQPRTTRSTRDRVQKRSRTIVIGRSRFSLAAGHQGTVRIKLTGKGRKLLRRAGKRGLKVRLVGHGLIPHTLHVKPRLRKVRGRSSSA